MQVYVLLRCWYEGDSNLVDDSFEAAGHSISGLVERVRILNPDRTVTGHERNLNSERTVSVYLPGEEVPDDGSYSERRKRYRIIQAEVIS